MAESHHDHTHCAHSGTSESGMATDPVCAMSVQPGDTTPHYQHGDATYWFCALSCRDEFVSSPERFLATLHDRRTPGAQPPRASMRSIDR